MGASDYAEIFSVADLKSTVKIYASDDKKKVYLLSYQLASNGNGYDTITRMYSYKTSWTNVTSLPSSITNFTTSTGVPSFFYISNMTTFVIVYSSGSVTLSKPVSLMFRANFTDDTFVSYDIPHDLTLPGVSLNYYFFENHLYLFKSFNGRNV